MDNAILSPVANYCMQSGMRLHTIVYTYYMNTFPGRLSSACIASSITRDTKAIRAGSGTETNGIKVSWHNFRCLLSIGYL